DDEAGRADRAEAAAQAQPRRGAHGAQPSRGTGDPEYATSDPEGHRPEQGSAEPQGHARTLIHRLRCDRPVPERASTPSESAPFRLSRAAGDWALSAGPWPLTRRPATSLTVSVFSYRQHTIPHRQRRKTAVQQVSVPLGDGAVAPRDRCWCRRTRMPRVWESALGSQQVRRRRAVSARTEPEKLPVSGGG